MHTTKKSSVVVAVVALATLGFLFAPASVQGQLGRAATTLGKGGNATATARGLGAISLNPAGLAMPGSGFSLSLLPMRVRSGLDPIGLSDLADVEGSLITTQTKEDWLDQVVANGSQTGSVRVDATWLALTFGNFGFQVTTVAGSSLALGPDVVEALLYGNAGRTGQPADLSFAQSDGNGWGVTTAALAAAFPISNPDADMAIGATVKYSVGHFVGVGRTVGGSFTSDPIGATLDLPIVHTDDTRLDDGEISNGTGVGVDVGFQMKRDKLSLGAAVLNAVNTFAWDESTLVYRPMSVTFVESDFASETDTQAYGGAPAALRAEVEDLVFNPIVTVGAGYDVTEDFTVTADVRNRMGDGGMRVGPKFHAGVGAEYRGLKVLHLRAGAAKITDGTQFAGGGSLILGPVNISIAGAMQNGDLGEAGLAQFSISFGGR